MMFVVLTCDHQWTCRIATLWQLRVWCLSKFTGVFSYPGVNTAKHCNTAAKFLSKRKCSFFNILDTSEFSNLCFFSSFSRSGLHGQIFKGEKPEEGPVEGSAPAETPWSSTWLVYPYSALTHFTSWFMERAQWDPIRKVIWQNMKIQSPREIWWLETQSSKDEFGSSCMAVAGHGVPEGRL